MRFENTDERMEQPMTLLFWSKALVVFSLLFIQNIHAQLVVAEGGISNSEEAIIVYESDSITKKIKPAARIYISSGVKIVKLDSDSNYEIVETISSEKEKIKFTKHLASKSTKPNSEKPTEGKKASTDNNSNLSETEFSTQESEVYFSFADGNSKISIPLSQFNVKHVLASENYKISLSFQVSKLVSVYFKVNGILTAQNKSAFSVRPPPFLA